MPQGKLMVRVREAARLRHFSLRTEQAYAQWIYRFVRFHGTRHPAELGAGEIQSFLSDLAVRGRVAASTQNQALAALLFLYRDVLGVELGRADDFVRATKPKRLPVVLTRDEVRRVLLELQGTHCLVAGLLYGAGLQLVEALRLRIKDVDPSTRTVRCAAARGPRIG